MNKLKKKIWILSLVTILFIAVFSTAAMAGEVSEEGDVIIIEPELHIGGLMSMPEEADLSPQSYYLPDWGTDDMLEEADARAQELVAELVTDDMPDIQKAFILAQYLNENVEYGVAPDCENYYGQTAYEALIKGEAVCAGYSSAYEMMCYYSGINVIYLKSMNMDHAWVEIELDGNWYYVDPLNCLVFDSFLMTPQNSPEYDQSDVGTKWSRHHARYDYENQVHPCTDDSFANLEYKGRKLAGTMGGINYYEYVLDWSVFAESIKNAGIDVNTYFSTRIDSIDAEYTGEKLFEGDFVDKKDVTVVPVSVKGIPNGEPVYTEGDALSADSFTVEKKVLELGNNEIEVEASFVSGPSDLEIRRVLSTLMNVTGNEDTLIGRKLVSIEAEYTGGEMFVGGTVDKSLIKVVPTYSYNYESGRSITRTGEEVIDFQVKGSVKEGNSTLTVTYSEDGITKETAVTVRGVYPQIVSIEAAEDEIVLENGSDIVLGHKDAADIILSNGDTISADVMWESGTYYDPDDCDEQTVTFKGNAIIPAGVRNETDVPTGVSTVVIVKAAKEQLNLTESIPAGICSESTMLELACAEGARIYYTINGSDEKLYHGPIPLRGHIGRKTDYEITAYAHLRGYADSELLEGIWTIDELSQEDAEDAELLESIVLVKNEKLSIFSENCKYESLNKRVASVNRRGIVKAKRAGEARINVYSDGVIAASYLIKVENPYFSKKKITIIQGDSYMPCLSGTDEEVRYYISESGSDRAYMLGDVLYAKSKGSLYLYAQVHGKKYKMKISIESPRFAKSVISLKKGRRQTLKMKGTSSRQIVYESSDPAVARVVNNKVYAVESGTAVITAHIGEHEYTCTVNVR